MSPWLGWLELFAEGLDELDFELTFEEGAAEPSVLEIEDVVDGADVVEGDDDETDC